MEIESLSFPEAVTRVADLGHVNIDLSGYATQASPEAAPNSQQQQLRQLYQDAADLFHHILLNTKLGETALAYTQQRQLTAELLDTFNIGYAPDENNLLTRFFAEKRSILIYYGTRVYLLKIVMAHCVIVLSIGLCFQLKMVRGMLLPFLAVR